MEIVDISSLQKLLKAKDEALQKLKIEFEEFKSEANEYEKELENDNEHKEKEIEALYQKVELLVKKIEDYKKEISQNNRIIEREQNRVTGLNEEVIALKARLVCMEQVNENLETDIRYIKFEKQELAERLEVLEERFIIEKEDIEEQFNQKNDELERLRLDMHEYEDEIARWKRKTLVPHRNILRSRSIDDIDNIEEFEDLAQYLKEINFRKIESMFDKVTENIREQKNGDEKKLEVQIDKSLFKIRWEESEKKWKDKEIELERNRIENAKLRQVIEEKEEIIQKLNFKIDEEKRNSAEQETVYKINRRLPLKETNRNIAYSENEPEKKQYSKIIMRRCSANLLNFETFETITCSGEEKSTRSRLDALMTELSAELEGDRIVCDEGKAQTPNMINGGFSASQSGSTEDSKESEGNRSDENSCVMVGLDQSSCEKQILKKEFAETQTKVSIEVKIKTVQEEKAQLEKDIHEKNERLNRIENDLMKLQELLNVLRSEHNDSSSLSTGLNMTKIDKSLSLYSDIFNHGLNLSPSDQQQSNNSNRSKVIGDFNISPEKELNTILYLKKPPRGASTQYLEFREYDVN